MGSLILIGLLVCGMCVVLSGCGEQAQEQENSSASTKESAPVPPPTSDIIEIPGDNPSSSNPSSLPEENVENKDWVPFVIPMVYCTPEGWNRYWNQLSTNDLSRKITLHNEYIAAAKAATPPNEPSPMEVKDWYKLDWCISDEEFITVDNKWTAQSLNTIVEERGNGAKILTEHKKYFKDTFGEHILKLCTNCDAKFPGYETYYDEYIKEHGKISLNPAVFLATLEAETNFMSWGTYFTMTGVGGAGTPQAVADPVKATIECYFRGFLVGEYLKKRGAFNEHIYYTDLKDISKRKDDFTKIFKDESVLTFNEYGFVFNKNEKSSNSNHLSGYQPDWIVNMEDTDNWALRKPQYAKYLDGFAFIPDTASLYARLKGFNTWLYFPSAYVTDAPKERHLSGDPYKKDTRYGEGLHTTYTFNKKLKKYLDLHKNGAAGK